MQRRNFLASSLAASTLGLAPRASAQSPAAPHPDAAQGPREFYELRRYQLASGPAQKLVNTYVADALIPALNRLGIQPVGAFNLDIGVETPALYLLLPCASVETLATAEHRLLADDEYRRAAQPFLNAPATQPPFVRVESSLFIAFEGHPKLTPTPASAQHGPRVFQLRTYESPTIQDHVRKVEMFHSGEFEIFQRAGFWQVFYGDALIGARLPNLTYMLAFPDLSELNARWHAFSSDPDWKKLTADPRFSFESIVSNITNLILNPAPYSQI